MAKSSQAHHPAGEDEEQDDGHADLHAGVVQHLGRVCPLLSECTEGLITGWLRARA